MRPARRCRLLSRPGSGNAKLSKRSSAAASSASSNSGADQVLKISELINLGAERLGQDGPDNRTDPTRFPPAQYRMVNCTGFRDYPFDFASSHQYYRRSPGVRADIAAAMGGAGV